MRTNLYVIITLVLLLSACEQSGFESLTKSSLTQNNQPPPNTDSQDTDEQPEPPPPVIPEEPTNNPLPEPTGPLGAAFFATGFFESTMYSCDGKSWLGYQSKSGNLRCGGEIDCHHSEYSPKGIAYGDKGFVATFGWGKPGDIKRTYDGKTFDVVLPGGSSAGLAFGNGTYVLNNSTPKFSQDLITWSLGVKYRFKTGVGNWRMIDFIPRSGGFFVAMGNSGEGDLKISRDNGVNFEYPKVLPEVCANTGTLAHNASIVLIRSKDALCYSTDGGETWIVNPHPEATTVTSSQNLFYNGKEFRSYSGTSYASSVDGIKWSALMPLKPGNVARFTTPLKLVTYHPALQTYVAFGTNEYEGSQFYQSDDGITWNLLESKNRPASPHSVRYISTGYLSSCKSQ